MRSPRLIALLLTLSTALVYLPVAWNEFVNYDDPDYITSNPHVRGGLTWENVKWAFYTEHSSNWHPLTWISHMIDCQIFGQAPAGHHLVNAAFHLANTLLLFFLLKALTGAVWRSALVAALFALHPLHVESVAWISERKDVLSTFFFLLTLCAYGVYAKQQSFEASQEPNQGSISHSRRRAQIYYGLALALFALGLMAKPMLVTLPFVLLLLDYWPLGRITLARNETVAAGRQRQERFLFLLLEKLPFLALSLVSCFVTFLAQRHGGAVSTSISLSARIANALVSYVRYLGKMFWPAKLSVLYPHPGHWPFWEPLACAALLAAIFGAVAMFGRKRPYLIVGWLWFFGTLIPVIGLIQVGVQSMADRYTYVPLIGVFIMMVWGVSELFLRKSSERLDAGAEEMASSRHPVSAVKSIGASGWTLWSLLIGGCLLACAMLTSRQNTFWRDSEALFRHAARTTKNNYLAYNNLGIFLANKGKTAEAMENYRESLRINPQYEDALNNLGYSLAGQKKFAEAIPYYEAALRGRPNQVEVHNNLGNALSELGRIDEAIEQYRFVLSHKPDHADAHNNLGIGLAMRGQFDEAIEHFHAALRYKPDYPSAHSNLGNAFAVQHKLDAAIIEYKEALRTKPDDAQAHNNLGNALAEQGLLEEAILHYQQALKLNADNPEGHFNLGMALARQGKRQQALEHYSEALRLKPDYIEARRQLAREGGTGSQP